jgi:hypothetical protein
MADPIQTAVEALSAPIEEVIAALGTGIARAQREMDRMSLEGQREIDEDPVLAETGLQATFYQIPRADLELSVAVALEKAPQPAPPPRPTFPFRLPFLNAIHLQPVNAKYANQFSFDVQASSKVKLTIVPVPPPGGDAEVTPNLTRQAVTDMARPFLNPATGTRLAVNFNGRSRTWFVLQFVREGDVTQRLALVVIDDETRKIIKTEAPPQVTK